MVEMPAELLGVLLMVLGIGIGFNLREMAQERLKARLAGRKRSPRQ
jgi:hypothetical protein